jgi:hypothetical protein
MQYRSASPALRFRLVGVPGTDVARVVWDEAPVSIDAAGLLAAAAGDDEERSALGEASDWLGELLALGPRPVSEVLRDARRDGHAERTVKRAKLRLGVQSSREGFGPGSKVLWFLSGRPPYSDPPTVSQTHAEPHTLKVGAVWRNLRNGAGNGHAIPNQRAIPRQPQKNGPVWDVGAVWEAPDPIVETARGLAALAPDELAAYRGEVASARGDDPHVQHDREALALLDAMRTAGASA